MNIVVDWFYYLMVMVLIGFFPFISACSFNEVTEDIQKGMYFDVNDYLKELTGDGFDTVRSVRKIVTHNGEREVKNIEEYNMDQEWNLMRRNDINTKALQGKYDVDSIRLNGDKRIGYYAQDPSYAVDSLFVTKSYGSIRSIEWNQSIKSIITDTRQQVIFRPESGIRVEKTIDPLLGGVDAITVEIQW